MYEKRIFQNCDDYTVTDDGRVFSYKSGSRKELSQSNTTKNKLYKVVTLRVGGKDKLFYVHRLVAGIYIPNPNNLPEVNHKDRNPANNHVNNLEWVTASENVIHKYLTDEYKECLICKNRIWTKINICKKCRQNIISKIESILLHETSHSENLTYSTKFDMVKMTDRQRNILTFIAKGYNQSDIARELNLTRQRISQIVKQISAEN